MYAVISTGGKQYKVAPGELIKLEKLSAEVGETVEFPVLLLAGEAADLRVRHPILADATVKASVVEHGRHDKIKITFRRRKHHRKQMGHRQYCYTAVKITEIL